MADSKSPSHTLRGARLTTRRRATRERTKKKLSEANHEDIVQQVPLWDEGDKSRILRGSKYKPEYARIAKEMCRLGAIDIEVARALGVSLSCLWAWQGTYQEFFEAMLMGQDLPNQRVERAYYQRCVGYTYPEVKIMSHDGKIVVVPFLTHIPPDTAAARHWLAKRDPERWAEKAKLDINLSSTEAFANLWRAISDGQVVQNALMDEPVEEENEA